jgi:predicted glycogen debranching enzyme
MLETSMQPLDFGREVTGDLDTAERREWLCTNGLGGYASGTVAGSLTRRYHGLLVAALAPPLGRTLVVSKLEETLVYDGDVWPLSTNRWASGAIDPGGYRHIERFHLDGTSPVWTYACADARIEKRIWMEPGANTTYVRYRVLRATGRVRLMLRVLVNHRDHHETTHGDGWTMETTPTADGVQVIAYRDAVPVLLQASGVAGISAETAHTWFDHFALSRERERGLDWMDDHLHAATFTASLSAGEALAFVASTETDPSLKGEIVWKRRRAWDDARIEAWRNSQPWAATAPVWIERLVLAADQFLARRPVPGEADGMTVIAGYPWFGDWGRDTMISLPGLTLATGRPEVGAVVLRTFARIANQGQLPNRFPDRGAAPEYNAVDATLWYFEAVRAHHQATGDDGLLKELYPTLASIVDWHRKGTRHGIVMDPEDGLLRAGESGVQLTWMDAKIDDHVVTPRAGKPIEVNALWLNALASMAAFARHVGRPTADWDLMVDRAMRGFDRFWNERLGYCHDVVDGPDGNDDTLRPNQIFAVSLPVSPLAPARQRLVVDACARHLVTSFGLRSLAPAHSRYCPGYAGDVPTRDGAYHQGPAWAWLLGPFALAHHRVYGDRELARSFLAPLAHHLADYGVGSIAEIFAGAPPHEPGGCIAQAWSVAETLRAWAVLADERRRDT